MEVWKTRKAAACVLALSILFGTLYGSHRSLTAEAKKITAQNEMVMKDLQTRVAVGENLYTVASRYLGQDSLGDLRKDLDYVALEPADMMGYADLTAVMRGVLFQLSSIDTVTEQDKKYLTGFETQLESGISTIARDPYTAQAEEFNTRTLRAFPARILAPLTGVQKIPVYQ